jgi:hypothetical protein
MDDGPIDFTFTPYDHQDNTWYINRELGQPDDPYNLNCKKIPKEDPKYSEYISIGQELCDQLEKDILTNEDDGWVFVQDKDGVVTHRKENEGSSILTFKGCTVIPTTPEILRLWLIQMDQRSFWDPTFVKGSYLLEPEVTARLAYYVYSAPWPVSYRDFIVVSSESIRENGLYIAGAHSVDNPDFPASEYVRGTIYSSGFVVKPIPSTEDGVPQCRVWYTGTVDTSGWIPTYVANLVNSQQPMNLATLRDLIVSVADMIMDVFRDLFNLDENNMKVDEIREIFLKNLSKYGHADRPNILYDALKNYFLKKRIGPSDDDLLMAMEREGKRKTMYKLFKSFQHYIVTLPAGRELYAIAKKYFDQH